ncbi:MULTISPECIES: hypothetical protein [Chitinophagaceae]
MPYQAFIPHFSMLALTSLFICSFALMQKNQKIKAVMPFAKNGLRSAKMPETCSGYAYASDSRHFLTLHFIISNQYFSASVGIVFFEIFIPQDGLLRE